MSARAAPMSTVPRRQLRSLPQGLCPFPCAAPPRRRASRRRVRAAALTPGASHSGACVAVCLQPTTTTPIPHCPSKQFLTPGRRGTTTAAAAAGGGRLFMGRVVVVLSPSLSPYVCGGWWHAAASIVSTRRVSAPALSPHSLGCRSVLCGQSGSAPSLHPRGARGGMCGEQPTCRLALGGTH